MNIIDDNGRRYSINTNNSIGSGGEGALYSLGDGNVVKIYFKASDAISPAKIKELSNLDGSIFVKPKVAVHGDANGFIMEELDLTQYFPLYSLFSTGFANRQNMPADYKRVISDKLIKGVKSAHDNSIVIGDINPFNIMVNSKMDVRFIDVDSYETPSCKHNDKLLEDIRDYYYSGIVSKESDYFALSVIIFNLLTGIHPYKGIHSVYRDRLKDREINNVSLLNKSELPNIKIPKFYQPIGDKSLSDMFYNIYQNNRRFLISMDGKKIDTVKFDSAVMSDELMVKELFSGGIRSVFTSKSYIAICTVSEKRLYSCCGRGIIMNCGVVDVSENLILTDKRIFSISGGRLRMYDTKKHCFINIENLTMDNVYCAKQYENILVVIAKNDKMYKIYLDEVYMNNVRFEISDAYHKSFSKVNGLFQTIGKNTVIFYNNGKTLSQYLLDANIRDIRQNGDTGMYTFIDGGNIAHRLFFIDSYGKMKTKQIDDIYPYTSNDRFIILFSDDKLHFLDKETLNEVAAFATDGLDNYQILSSSSGIIVHDNAKCMVLNTK